MDCVTLLQRLKDLKVSAEKVQASSCKMLTATLLVSDEAHAWLDQALKFAAVQLSKLCNDFVTSLDQADAAASSLALKVPNFKDEASFRELLGKLSSQMAQQGKTLAKHASELRAAALELPEALSEREDFLAQAKTSAGLARLLTVFVTLFACVTVLRSPSMGTKTDAGKKVAKNLESLLYTLLAEDLRPAPPCDALEDATLTDFWDEAKAAVRPPIV